MEINNVLLDTNCLIILVIGMVDEFYLRSFSKTKEQKYVDAFEILNNYLNHEKVVFISNSYIMCELLHNVIENKDFDKKYSKKFIELLNNLLLVKKLKILEMPLSKILSHNAVYWLGFTDISCVQTSKIRTIITFDVELANQTYQNNRLSTILLPLNQ